VTKAAKRSSILKIDLLTTAGLFAVSLLVYIRTLAPTISWRNEGADSGDLVTAAFTGGIPHPTGYPLYTLIASVFSHLPALEPAQAVGLFSALAAAGTIALFYRVARLVMVAPAKTWLHELGAAAVALSLAFAPLFWSQATIAEVYALDALIVTALFFVLISDRWRHPALAALILGLGLAHHISIILLAPSALWLLWFDSKWSVKRIVAAGLCLVAPLLFYLVLPIRAAANPPVNWGNPSTLEGFWWTVSAAPYRSYFMNFKLADAFGRLGTTAQFLLAQFNIWGTALGLWGLAKMIAAQDPRVRRRGWALALGFVLTVAFAILYGTHDSYIYLPTAFIIFSLWMAFGIGDIIGYFNAAWASQLCAAALVLFAGYNLVANFQTQDCSNDRTAMIYAESAFKTMPPDSIVISDGSEHLFSLWYYRYVVARESSRVVVVSSELLQYDWYYDQIKRLLPGMIPPLPTYQARLGAVLDLGLRDGRGLYTTSNNSLFAAYTTQPQGALYRIGERRK
jgi:hypothetical protein